MYNQSFGGNTNPTASANAGFGGGTFGNQAQNTGNVWGAGASGAATGFGPAQIPPNNGTGNPSYQVLVDKDSGQNTLYFHSISASHPYLAYSPEELRVKDYELGKKVGRAPGFTNSGGSAWGSASSSGFPQNSITAFAQKSGFSTSTGGFAKYATPSTSTSGFGASSQPSGFAAPQASGFGAWSTSGTSAFGKQNTLGSSAFGNTSGSGFGASSTGFRSTPGTAFGAGAGTGTGFPSQTPPTTSAFGSGFAAAQPSSTFASGSAFGKSAFGASESSQPQSAFGGTSAFGAKPSGFGGPSAFGSSTAGQAPATGFGNAGATSSFGQPSGTGFGASLGQKSAFGSALGTQNVSSPSAATGGFPSTATSTAFPSTSTGTTAFGAQQGQTGTSGPSLFGGGIGSKPGGALGFGQQSQQNRGFGQSTAFGGGLGSQPGQQGAFGLGSGGFGQSQQRPQAFGGQGLASGSQGSALVSYGTSSSTGQPRTPLYASLEDDFLKDSKLWTNEDEAQQGKWSGVSLVKPTGPGAEKGLGFSKDATMTRRLLQGRSFDDPQPAYARKPSNVTASKLDWSFITSQKLKGFTRSSETVTPTKPSPSSPKRTGPPGSTPYPISQPGASPGLWYRATPRADVAERGGVKPEIPPETFNPSPFSTRAAMFRTHAVDRLRASHESPSKDTPSSRPSYSSSALAVTPESERETTMGFSSVKTGTSFKTAVEGENGFRSLAGTPTPAPRTLPTTKEQAGGTKEEVRSKPGILLTDQERQSRPVKDKPLVTFSSDPPASVIRKKLPSGEQFEKRPASDAGALPPTARVGKALRSLASHSDSEEEEADRFRDTPLHLPRAVSDLFGSTASSEAKAILRPGQYGCIPSPEEIEAMTPAQKGAVKNFCVFRRGFGEVKFLEPVDLRGVSDIRAMLNGKVILEEATVVVLEDALKNHAMRVRVKLHQRYIDSFLGKDGSSSGGPVNVEELVGVLKAIEKTIFEDYDPVTQVWSFTHRGCT